MAEELAEGAKVMELEEDEESTNVLVTLEILVSVELMGVEASELVMELIALVEEPVGELDVVALALEGYVLNTLSVVDKMEVTAGELKDELANDDTPLLVELEINGVAED